MKTLRDVTFLYVKFGPEGASTVVRDNEDGEILEIPGGSYEVVGQDDEWWPSLEPCPECGAKTETADWWDDAPENGGQVIGTLHQCTKCDWFVSR